MITKADMIEMFQRYILPSSPARAKLAIHLHAKSISGVSSPAQTTVSSNTVAKVTDIMEKGIDMLKLGTGVKKPYYDNNVTNVAMESSRKGLYVIGDVRDYKSRLGVTAGPQPVRDLCEFEDIEYV
jgi:insulysin